MAKKAVYDTSSFLKRAVGYIQRKLFRKKETYQAVIDPNAPWIFVNYIADVFYCKDEEKLSTHQNKRETLQMARVFNELGYNAYFMQCNSTKKLPDIHPAVVFGHESNFERACRKYKDAKKIYYGVSVYYEYRNRKIREMTNHFNRTFHAKVPCRRLVKPSQSVALADEVLLIGSENTVATFPAEFRHKITKIHQSMQKTEYLREYKANGNGEFMFLASSGNVLKGISPLIEFFSGHQNLQFHWVGTVEKDVFKAIEGVLTPNIHVYGHMHIGSAKALELFAKCDFIIYPSGVDAGSPGSVLNAMKNGLIPLVTQWAAFDGMEEYGYIMNGSDVQSVSDAVDWALTLSKEEILERKKKGAAYVLNTYNLDNYTRELRDYFKEKCPLPGSKEKEGE